uniref:Peptidoglycan-binding protein n=1 Tax=Streptomyces sp. NBC_00049 TaxID=2903617 RepID=A0AAU2JN54_9ACTN
MGPHDDTPAYGVPVLPPHQPWPAGPEHMPPPPPAATVPFGALPQPVAAPDAGWGGGGAGAGSGQRSGGASRRLLPVLLGAAAAVALGGTALAVWVVPGSDGNDTALMDAKASAPAITLAPPEPSPSPSTTAGRSASPSPSRSPSPSASKSPSPSASRSSAAPSASASAGRSPSPTPSRPAAGPTLRYGDSGPEVEKLQRLLAAQGLFRSKVNGKFDWRVENAVSTFQFNNDIDEEWGVYGPVTRRALEG